MSNVLRAKLKKFRNDKKADKSKPKEKRGVVKSAPTVSPEPCANGNSHKSSLSADSPVHVSSRVAPTSPLVMSKSSSTTHLSAARRESSQSLPNVGAPPAVPKVNVGSYDDPPLDREGIIGITVDVQNFLVAISSLKKAMEEADTVDEVTIPGPPPSSPSSPLSLPTSTSLVFSNLSDLIQVTQTCLSQHPGMQSTEIKDAAKNLMTSYQTCTHENASTCSSCNQAIESLIDAFTNSVHSYLTGDTLPQDPPQQHRKLQASSFSSTNMLKGFSKSHENLASRYSSYLDLSQQFNEPIVDQIDQALTSTENGVEVATRYIKFRTKYHKEITAYLNKRAQIEAKYQQQMVRLGKTTQMALQELQSQEECLPLIDVFGASVEQDMKFAVNCNTTFNLQVGNKLIEHLERKISECERVRRELTHTWQREQKKLAEAKTAMKNAKAKYRFLGQDLARVKNILAADPYGKQAEKRKKEVSDLEAKWQEAEGVYKSAVAECNDCQYQVHVAAQKSILCAYRRAVIDVDMALKSGLERYFQLEHNFFTSLPDPLHRNILDVREYEVGTDFMRYVQRHPQQQEEPEDFHFEEFDPDTDMEPTENLLVEGTRMPNSTSAESTFFNAEDSIRRTERAPSPQPLQAWDQSTVVLNDSRGSSSTPSPRTSKRKMRPRSMAFLLDSTVSMFESPKSSLQRRNSDQSEQVGKPVSTAFSPQRQGYPEEPAMSKNAVTHSLRKLRGPARCRECDTYVYFHGFECEVCGLACHKKCLATLAIRCGSKRLARKMNTFGVDFHKHLKATKRFIPIIVTKCINEMDDRGLDTKGLYRVSSAKTKIEHLCQLFESGADRVDLSDQPCHLIGSCLKLYFRQLPEPVLTFGLYHEFISFAREASYILPCDLEKCTGDKRTVALETLERLRGLLQKLPYENYVTLARLLFHLARVGSPPNSNVNLMPPSNLGIVFGPNLLRQRDAVASLALLADMAAQAKAIEILISHVHHVFHVTEEKIIREIEQEYDDSETTEVLVDEAVDQEPMTSPQLGCLDGDDNLERTPLNTPPERRRENVGELGEVLEALQSVSVTGRRSSYPGRVNSPSNVSLSFLRPPTTEEQPQFLSLPGSISSNGCECMDTATVPSRYLRPQLGFDKILTPVEEWPADVETEENYHDSSQEDNDQCIVSSTSSKLDGTMLSRSASGLSNPSSMGVVGDMESEVSSTRDIDHEESSASILSGEYDTQPRRIFGLSHSMEDMINSSFGLCDSSQDQQRDTGRVFEEDITKLLQGQSSNDTQDSSQGSDDSSPFSSENVQALLDRTSPSTSPRGSFPSSGEGTPISFDKRTNSSNRRSYPHSPNSFNPISPHHAQAKKHPNHGNSQSNGGIASSYPGRPNQGAYSETSGTANKYSRYDRNRLVDSSSDLESRSADVEGKSPSSTQDSNGTITEGDNGVEHSTRDETVEDQHELSGQSKECAEKGKQTKDPSGGSLKHSQLLKETHRQTDSGIEEASIHEMSKVDDCRISGTNDDDEVPLPDGSEHSKSLSYAALFTSCESGLDSPDADSIDEHSKSDHQNSTDESYLKQDPHVDLFIVPNDGPPKPVPYRNRMSQTSLSSDGSYDMGPTFAEVEDRRSSVTAPRSLEGPSFSKYARVPIRHSDSKYGNLMKTEGAASRRRAESLDGISDAIAEAPHHERQNSTGSGTSESNLDLGTRLRHQAAAVFQVEQRFKRRTLSESSSSSRDEYNPPRAKLALRVLRITPNTDVSTTPPPPKEHALQATLSEADETSDECEVQTAKLRMMSPEVVVPQLPRLIEMPLRRSQSEESFNQDSSSSGVVLTKVGSLYVIPEVKPHSLTIGTEREEDPTHHHRQSQPSPSVLIDIDHTRRVSVDSFGSRSSDSSNPQSPKNKKRGRAPKFV